ncbi:MAG: hypothetical protein P8X88_02850, partial [Gammaproteobacteria bacterium]
DSAAYITGETMHINGGLYMISQDTQAFIELVPGKVLTGLSKRIDKSTPCYGVYDLKSLEQALEKAHELV